MFSGEFCTTPQEFVKEILDVVPPYVKFREIVRNSKESVTKCHRLEKKLEIATKALKDIKVYSQRDWDEYNCMECAGKALKEMEGVK